MTGQTHRQYSICFAYITTIILFRLGISNINYYLGLPIVLLTAKSGALFPDLDHTWVNVHDKTMLNKIINVLIHITGGKHRSWQTHSLDICAVCSFLAVWGPMKLYDTGKISVVNKEVLFLVLVGFMSGWISHMFSDMLTSGGIRLFCWWKFKLRLVPRKIGKLKFNTGNEWEKFNYVTMKKINCLLGIICIAYPFIFNSGILNKGA